MFYQPASGLHQPLLQAGQGPVLNPSRNSPCPESELEDAIGETFLRLAQMPWPSLNVSKPNDPCEGIPPRHFGTRAPSDLGSPLLWGERAIVLPQKAIIEVGSKPLITQKV